MEEFFNMNKNKYVDRRKTYMPQNALSNIDYSLWSAN
jgi:hypothetical protein